MRNIREICKSWRWYNTAGISSFVVCHHLLCFKKEEEEEERKIRDILKQKSKLIFPRVNTPYRHKRDGDIDVLKLKLGAR
jgi:hypothetical protein